MVVSGGAALAKGGASVYREPLHQQSQSKRAGNELKQKKKEKTLNLTREETQWRQTFFARTLVL